jgi:hypothetical protein
LQSYGGNLLGLHELIHYIEHRFHHKAFTFTGAIIMSFQYDNLFLSGSYKLSGFQAQLFSALTQGPVAIH